jgi:zinc transporter
VFFDRRFAVRYLSLEPDPFRRVAENAAMTDNPGVVFALSLDGRGGGRHIEPAAFSDSVPAWMHLDFSSRGVRELLREQGLEPYVVDTLTRLESRPHSLAVGDALMVILRGINRNAGADPEDMVSIRIWLESDRVLTVRQRPVKAAQLARDEIDQGNGAASTGELLLRVITHLADGIALFVDDTEERMDACEEKVEHDGPGEVRSDISAIRRQVAAVRRYLAPQREALESLNRLSGSLLDVEQLFTLREQSNRVTRYVEDLDLVRERALVVQEEIMNRIAQEQNARTYLFSVVATIFLPITFISGMFGMNTAGLPGLETEGAFWIVFAGMAAVTIGVTIWLRMKKWF